MVIVEKWYGEQWSTIQQWRALNPDIWTTWVDQEDIMPNEVNQVQNTNPDWSYS